MWLKENITKITMGNCASISSDVVAAAQHYKADGNCYSDGAVHGDGDGE